jgi:hypothetical protein
MLVMGEKEFKKFVWNWVDMLDDEEQEENAEALHRSLCELFLETCDIHNVQGIIVWKGDLGCYPTELVWIEDTETFVVNALKEVGLTEEAGIQG